MLWHEKNLINRYFEMAESDSFIKKGLHDVSDVIIYHIYKIYYIPIKDSRRHWSLEIFSFLNKINKRKSTKKYPPKSFIYNNVFGNQEDSFEEYHISYLEDLSYDYPDYEFSTKKDDVLILKNICGEYFQWLSKNLSEKGSVSKREVLEKLESIIT